MNYRSEEETRFRNIENRLLKLENPLKKRKKLLTKAQEAQYKRTIKKMTTILVITTAFVSSGLFISLGFGGSPFLGTGFGLIIPSIFILFYLID